MAALAVAALAVATTVVTMVAVFVVLTPLAVAVHCLALQVGTPVVVSQIVGIAAVVMMWTAQNVERVQTIQMVAQLVVMVNVVHIVLHLEPLIKENPISKEAVRITIRAVAQIHAIQAIVERVLILVDDTNNFTNLAINLGPAGSRFRASRIPLIKVFLFSSPLYEMACDF